MMRTDSNYFENLIQNDAGYSLLKTKTAGLVISFFYQEFIIYNRVYVLTADVAVHLDTFLQDHKGELEDFEQENSDDFDSLQSETKDRKQKVRGFIEKWCKKGYLLRYYNTERDSVLELTQSILKLFTWIDSLKPKKFIGTESQFKTILDQLHDLYQHITEDTESRLKALKEEKANIEKEIKRLETGGKVETYSPVQIFEMVDLCLRNGKDLLNDFRQVEDNFRIAGSEIYKKQSELNFSKGDILGFALDTDEKLRESPQGQSFDAFWKFIAEDNDNEINIIANAIIEKVSASDEIGQLDAIDIDFLLNFKKNLFEAGSKIIDTKRGITDKLSRVLQQNQNGNYQKLNSLINDIKKIATEKFSAEDYVNQKNFMRFDTRPAVTRAYVPVLPDLHKEFAEMESFDSSAFEISDYTDLLNQFFVDRKKIIQNIKEFRKKHSGQFSLGELLEVYPITKGMAEVAVYYDLIHSESGLTVDENIKEQLQYEKNGEVIKISVPKLIIQGGGNV